VQRFNADLANGLGNLASRTLSMIHQYCDGKVPPAGEEASEVASAATQTAETVQSSYESLDFSKALEAVWGLIGQVDKFIVTRKPWVLVKSGEAADQGLLADTLYTAAEALRMVAVLAGAGASGYLPAPVGAARLRRTEWNAAAG
jgi:methionyl-tRNA synthetase